MYQNVLVCAVIHSPSSTSFDLFDNLLVLKEGRVFFAGAQVDLLDYLTCLGFNWPPGQRCAFLASNFVPLQIHSLSLPEFLLSVLADECASAHEECQPLNQSAYFLRFKLNSTSIVNECGNEVESIAASNSAPSCARGFWPLIQPISTFWHRRTSDLSSQRSRYAKKVKLYLNHFLLTLRSMSQPKSLQHHPPLYTRQFLVVFHRCSRHFLHPSFYLQQILHFCSGRTSFLQSSPRPGLLISLSTSTFSFLPRQPNNICAITPFALKFFCATSQDQIKELSVFCSLACLFCSITVCTPTLLDERLPAIRDRQNGLSALVYFAGACVSGTLKY